MFHLDNTSAVPEMPEPKEPQSNSPRWFGESQQQGGISWPGADWFNIVQKELLNILADADVEPDKADHRQVANSIKTISITSVLDIQGYFFHEEGIDVSADLQAWINTHPKTTIPMQGYNTIIKSNIIVPNGHELVIDNDIEQITNEVDTWTTSHVISLYPMFRVAPGSTGVVIRGNGWLHCIYEGVVLEGGETEEAKIFSPIINIKVKGKLVDNSGNKYSKFSGIAAYRADDADLSGSRVFNCGIRPSWNGTIRLGGGANGFGLYSCFRPRMHGTWTYRCGGCGVFTNAVSDPNFQHQRNISNGLSGIQYGPHPLTTCGIISNNYNVLNTADGIDIRWTGTGTVSIKILLNGNFHYRNGFFDEDVTKPTQDGSGLATIAFVTGVTMNGNLSIESAGSGLYLQGCSSVSGAGNSASVYTNKEGVFLGGGTVADIKLIGLRITTAGTALNFGGSSAFYDIDLQGIFNSTASYGAVTGAGSTFNNVTINAIIYSKATMFLLGGGWGGSTFFMSNGASLNVGNVTFDFRNVKLRFDSGSFIVTGNLSNMSVDGLNTCAK